jgi:hypothetical protein
MCAWCVINFIKAEKIYMHTHITPIDENKHILATEDLVRGSVDTISNISKVAIAIIIEIKMAISLKDLACFLISTNLFSGIFLYANQQPIGAHTIATISAIV